jgi:hypothetical protein
MRLPAVVQKSFVVEATIHEPLTVKVPMKTKVSAASFPKFAFDGKTVTLDGVEIRGVTNMSLTASPHDAPRLMLELIVDLS